MNHPVYTFRFFFHLEFEFHLLIDRNGLTAVTDLVFNAHRYSTSIDLKRRRRQNTDCKSEELKVINIQLLKKEQKNKTFKLKVTVEKV